MCVWKRERDNDYITDIQTWIQRQNCNRPLWLHLSPSSVQIICIYRSVYSVSSHMQTGRFSSSHDVYRWAYWSKIMVLMSLKIPTCNVDQRHHSRNGNAWVLCTHGIVWLWHREAAIFKLQSSPQDPTRVRFNFSGQMNVSFHRRVLSRIDLGIAWDSYPSFSDVYDAGSIWSLSVEMVWLQIFLCVVMNVLGSIHESLAEWCIFNIKCDITLAPFLYTVFFFLLYPQRKPFLSPGSATQCFCCILQQNKNAGLWNQYII